MNDIQQQAPNPSAKERVTKALAVIGFLGSLIALAWLIFTGIGFLPALFSNLANVIQTETDYKLSTYPLEDSISHNNTVGIEWSPIDAAGDFAFSFACTEGVSAEIRTLEQGIQNLACDTPYSLGTATGVDITLRSASNRFTDVPYTVTFIPANNPGARVSATNRIAVFNPDISILDTEEEVIERPATSSPVANESGDDTSEPTITENQDTAPTPPATPPTYVTQYEIPVSDPNGTTNLHISYLGVGALDSNNKFMPLASLDKRTTGAIRFAVTNTGTRTSESWTYSATLPNGQTHSSSPQDALKPNETATLTLGFQTGNTDGDLPFDITVDTALDTDHSDNDLRWSVRIR